MAYLWSFLKAWHLSLWRTVLMPWTQQVSCTLLHARTYYKVHLWRVLTWWPRSTAPFTARSKLGRGEEIKWQELLTHFRSVQSRHEKARRQALGIDRVGIISSDSSEKASLNASSSSQTRPQMRRKVTGEAYGTSSGNTNRSGALSPLNPRSRGGGFFTASQNGGNRPRSPTQTQNKSRRTLTLKS